MSSMFLEWINYWDSRQLIIWNSIVIGIPLTIWLGFKIRKINEKIKDKKNKDYEPSLVNIDKAKSLETESEKSGISCLGNLLEKYFARNNDISGNVLILSDRMTRASKTFGNYLESETAINFIGVVTKIDDLKNVNEKVDYLIIYGYLKNYENYNIIDAVRKKNSEVTTIFYAIISVVVKREAKKKNIKFLFNRYAPLAIFLIMLRKVSNRYDTDNGSGIKVDDGLEQWEFSEWDI